MSIPENGDWVYRLPENKVRNLLRDMHVNSNGSLRVIQDRLARSILRMNGEEDIRWESQDNENVAGANYVGPLSFLTEDLSSRDRNLFLSTLAQADNEDNVRRNVISENLRDPQFTMSSRLTGGQQFSTPVTTCANTFACASINLVYSAQARMTPSMFPSAYQNILDKVGGFIQQCRAGHRVNFVEQHEEISFAKFKS